MLRRQIAIIGRRHLRSSRTTQLALVVIFWLIGEGLVRIAHIPLPGGIAGMLVLLALFALGGLKPLSIRRGAQSLLTEMLLFFVPAVLAIMDHHEFLGWLGFKALLVIITGTLIVMATTAFVVEWCVRRVPSEGESYVLK